MCLISRKLGFIIWKIDFGRTFSNIFTTVSSGTTGAPSKCRAEHATIFLASRQQQRQNMLEFQWQQKIEKCSDLDVYLVDGKASTTIFALFFIVWHRSWLIKIDIATDISDIALGFFTLKVTFYFYRCPPLPISDTDSYTSGSVWIPTL